METTNSAASRRRRNLGSRTGASRGGKQDRDELQAAAEDQHDHRRIFENNLIFDKIFSYLTSGDMTLLGQVSHLTLDKVRSKKEFAENTKLLVNKESYDTVRRTDFHWKIITFELGPLLQNQEMISLKRVLRHAEVIEIVDKSRYYNISNTKWANCMQTVISSSPDLQRLSLDNRLIAFRKFVSVLKKSSVVKALGNLKELEIFKEKGEDIPCIDKESQPAFAKGLQEILVKTSNLRSFRFGKIDTRNSTEINQAIVNIVEKNRETLTDLSLSIQPWRQDGLRTLVCPLLSKLNIVFKCKDAGVVKTFLQNQPLLTSLKIQSLDECPLSLIPCIKANSSELRQLHFKVPTFIEDQDQEDEEIPIVDWTFLADLNHLEDFAMVRAEDKEIHPEYDAQNTLDYISIAGALHNLPSTIQKIYLCGLEFAWPAEVETTAAIITMLSRFTSLTELSFFDCPNIINDEVLQFICSNFTKLRVLGFSKCSTLTSFGFTGVREGLNTGVSIKDLKGLRKLRIDDCTLAEPGPLLECLKFLELTVLELDFDSYFRITNEFAVQIARQNPSLEYLIGIYVEEEKEVEEEIKKFHPRFRAAVFKCSDGNSDAMTAYGYDVEGNETNWMHGSFSDDNDSFLDYFDDYDQDHEQYMLDDFDFFDVDEDDEVDMDDVWH